MLRIKNILTQSIWQNFFNENCYSSFLHSWHWGEFQKSLGNDVLRLGIYEKNKLQAIAQVIKIKTKRGRFLFIPHGPIITNHLTSNFKHQTSKIKTLITQLLNYCF